MITRSRCKMRLMILWSHVLLDYHQEKVTAEAKRKGLDNNYIYMNYASQFEDQIGCYGAANIQGLKAVPAKYGPTINLMPGHFKLGKGVPNYIML